MKYTDSLIKTRKQASKETESINAELLTRAGFVDQSMAGVYTYLPLGLRVYNKIEAIIREEMEAMGGQEVLMPVLQVKDNWEKTGRWDSLDDLFKFTSFYSKIETALGPTHEETIAPLAKKYIFSYKDLPKYLFQIQTKFRDEKRAKAGLLRGREFIMKDLYSFHASEKDLDDYYNKMKEAYLKIFARVGIAEKTYLTYASGGSFSKYSHEFQTETPAGEDTIYLCGKCKVAINKEIIEEQKMCPECQSTELKELKGIEVGNIFKLGTKYSKPFELKYVDENNKEQDVVMGCYGIGLGRLMGTVVEIFHDERGIIWPASVAPYQVHLIDLDGKNKEAKELYAELQKAGVEVLWDNREESAGVKLADADLLGIPYRVVVSEKTEKAGKYELKARAEKETKLVDKEELLKEVAIA